MNRRRCARAWPRAPRATHWPLLTAALAVAAPTLAACREDPGDPDYTGPAGRRPDAGGATGFLEGPVPYVPGTERLSLGAFYEGGASETIPVDGVTRNYFIFVIEGTSNLTYTQETTEDRVEGLLADRIEHEARGFWGGGLVWTEPTDLSEWTELAVSFKSEDPAFEEIRITLQSGEGTLRDARLDATDYGWVNDGEWHSLRIPIADFVAVGHDPTRVRSPFIMGGGNGSAGEQLVVDDHYTTQD